MHHPVGALIGGMLAGIIGFGAAAGGAKIVDDILREPESYGILYLVLLPAWYDM